LAGSLLLSGPSSSHLLNLEADKVIHTDGSGLPIQVSDPWSLYDESRMQLVQGGRREEQDP
jgi:hypothetical protein